ncbi:MAG: hypothetical protein ACU843_11140 [Gammaproteobacteria bacterium]
MRKTIRYGRAGGLAVALGIFAPVLYGGVPAGQDELRIYPGDPQNRGESIVSISGRWTTDDGLQTGFTALTFLNGSDRPKPDNAKSVAKKVAISVKRGMAYLGSATRGLAVEFDQQAERPRYVIKNRENFSVSKITVRDYINDKYTTEIAGKSFGQQGVKVSLDLTEAASVGKVVINAAASEPENFRAEGGGIEITIGDGKPVMLETKSKSPEEIERELAAKLGGRFSTSPLFPDEREKRDEKNIKPFDGGEVQLENLATNAFTIEVKDPSLGMINRYQFRESESGGGGGWW